jgi:hypothetical protein
MKKKAQTCLAKRAAETRTQAGRMAAPFQHGDTPRWASVTLNRVPLSPPCPAVARPHLGLEHAGTWRHLGAVALQCSASLMLSG